MVFSCAVVIGIGLVAISQAEAGGGVVRRDKTDCSQVQTDCLYSSGMGCFARYQRVNACQLASTSGYYRNAGYQCARVYFDNDGNHTCNEAGAGVGGSAPTYP